MNDTDYNLDLVTEDMDWFKNSKKVWNNDMKEIDKADMEEEDEYVIF